MKQDNPRQSLLTAGETQFYKQRLVTSMECANCGRCALTPVLDIGTAAQLDALRHGGICEQVLQESGAAELGKSITPTELPAAHSNI
jgi:hypothetical protein